MTLSDTRCDRRALTALLVTATLFAGACSSSADSGGTTSAADSATPTTATTEPVTTEPVTSEPATSEPATTEPATTTAEDVTTSSPEPTADGPAASAQVLRSDLEPALGEALLADIDGIVAEYGPPGVLVGVLLAGEGEFVATAGVADLDTDAPITEDMHWPLRSVTKAFTVTMILQLVDEGLLSLDDTIEAYTPDLPNADRVTIRQLAEMTSGLPEYTTEAWIEEFLADEDRVFTTDELIAFAAAEPAQFEPGADRVYTNSNTLVLGKIVEDVTGQSYAEALQERILDPLDMTSTVYAATGADWLEPHAIGYQRVGEEFLAQGDNFSVFGGAGAMISTLHDMWIAAPALANGTLVEPQTQQERVIGAPLSAGPEYDQYALGIGELNGWWGHTGEGLGFTLVVMGRPGTDDAVVIFMNGSGLDAHVPTKLMREIAATLADG